MDKSRFFRVFVLFLMFSLQASSISVTVILKDDVRVEDDIVVHSLTAFEDLQNVTVVDYFSNISSGEVIGEEDFLGREFIIMNTLADVRNVSLRAEGDLSEYILFDTHPLLGDLGAGESTTFTVSLRIPENASDGFYRGKIVVSTEKSGSVSIPVVVDVTHNRYGFVTFNVTDNRTGEPIMNALISLSGDNDDYVAETDNEGKASMVVWSGRYNYLSSAGDYLSKSGNVDIPPGDPDVSISLARKPIIRVTVQILDENGEFLPIDQSTGLPVVQSQRTYHFKMTIIVNTGQVINEDNIYVPPEFMPSTSSGEPASYTISREGDTYYVDWQVYTGDDFHWPLNDNIVVAAPYYAQAASPAPGRIPLEIEGDMHFGGEKFMVRAIIENLKEDPNDPTALPADAIGVKATLVRPAGISLISGQNETLYPFIFTSDSNWTVDVCVHVPEG